MRTFLFSLMIMLLLSVTPAMAETPKIGIINLDRLLTECTPGKAAQSMLEEKIKESKEELDKLKAELEELQEELEKQSVALSQEVQQEKVMEFRQRYVEYSQMVQQSQRAVAEEQQRALQPIIDVLMEVVIKYGDDEGFTIILDTKNGGVAYADESVNVTDDILEIFEEEWKNR